MISPSVAVIQLHAETGASDPTGLCCKERVIRASIRRRAHQTSGLCCKERVIRASIRRRAHHPLRVCAVRKGLYASPYGDGRIPACGGDRAIPGLRFAPAAPRLAAPPRPLLSLARFQGRAVKFYAGKQGNLSGQPHYKLNRILRRKSGS
jgi:hypothetical protein